MYRLIVKYKMEAIKESKKQIIAVKLNDNFEMVTMSEIKEIYEMLNKVDPQDALEFRYSTTNIIGENCDVIYFEEVQKDISELAIPDEYNMFNLALIQYAQEQDEFTCSPICATFKDKNRLEEIIKKVLCSRTDKNNN